MDKSKSGEIGRRAGLRIQFRKEWGFKSLLLHQKGEQSMVKHANDNLLFSFIHHDAHECTATITVKNPLVEALYRHAILEQKKHLQTDGFPRGMVPLSYIESTCRAYILDHLKEFFFNHSIITFLCQELYSNKIVIAGEPILKAITVDNAHETQFIFTLKTINPNVKHEWKKFPFKSPARKNYKDLDRQVETFLKEEEEKRKIAPKEGIQPSDWICFTVSIVSATEHQHTLATYKSALWLKIGREEPDREAHELFIGKKVGDHFTTSSNFLQHYFSKKLDTQYLYDITIIEHVPAECFSLDLFKHHFKIKSVKELHQKFIEIFSFRNDISQRREIVESAFKTLLKYYQISLPHTLVDDQEKLVLRALRRNPDYPVYKAQKDFARKVTLLAEKQLKEAILVDHIAQQEQIHITQDDIKAYLNMLQRARTKEFIHFNLPTTQLSGQEQPLPAGILHQACLREKTLNYIIQRLIHG